MASLPLAAELEPAGEGAVISQKYRLESLLGEGGMGSIWRAYNLQLEVPVAIKLLRAGLNPLELGERLRVEARAAAKLVHPSIVRVFDIGEAESGEPFIVMELLQGQSLGTMLEDGPLSATAALQLMLPIAEALTLAHSRGVVHRDLKPDNIFIAHEAARLQPKLLDFGIAKVQSSMSGGPTLTQAGMLLGSPDYMSPEQAYGLTDIDERSDIWSYCVVLYELLSGRTPFAGETCQEILQAVLTHTPVPLELLEVEPTLAALVHWGLSKDRDARPTSMRELGCALAGWLLARGVLEDVTGSSLETNWLGRANDAALSTTPPRLGARAEHEEATLVSVVHPSPHPSHHSVVVARGPQRRRWLPSAVVSAVALGAGIGWASVHELGSAGRPLGGAPTGEPVPAPAAASPPAAIAPAPRVEAVTIESLPVEPALAKPAEKPSAAPKPRAKVWPSSAASPAAAPPSNTALANAPPRALPQALPTREQRVELLDPY